MVRAALILGALIVIVLSIGITLLAFSVGSEDDLLPVADVSFRNDPVQGGVISVVGLLTPKTVRVVQQLLALDRATTLRVWSAGGTGAAAAQLAEVVNRARLSVRVEKGAVCSSACVIFLADVAPDLRAINPSAWLRVHGRSSGPDDPKDDDPSMRMDRWVGEISPRWLAFLRGCASKPLARDAGIAMAWAEVQAPDGIDCARISHRTKEWLFHGAGSSIGARLADQARVAGP